MAVAKKQNFGNMSASYTRDYYDDIYEKLESSTGIITSKGISLTISEEILESVDRYIIKNYAPVHQNVKDSNNPTVSDCILGSVRQQSAKYAALPNSSSINEIMEKLEEPFALTLVRLIDSKGYTSVEIYTRANIDRKLFSKIRSDKAYKPSKKIVLALAVALELTHSETEDFLKRAGFAFTHSRKFDLIVEYFIINKQYDIHEINEVLYRYDQPLLGG